MKYKECYVPGPSNIRENVKIARSLNVANPDIDTSFADYYKEVSDKFGKLIGTQNEIYLLSGEGILGLECAVASLTETGDRVLVIDNGIFGKGFGDFVSIYEGKPVYFSSEYKKEVDLNDLELFLKKDSNFKYATVIHCDTPTGVINNVHKICPLLKKYGILTVVDSVAGMIGETLDVDKAQIDIILGGSQKALSAPVGLTMVGVSEDAKNAFKNRKTPIRGFYCNLRIWENYYKEKYFPYTLPAADIVAFERAVDNVIEEGIETVVRRHENIARALRYAVVEYGLKLYLESGYSNNVTVVEIPENIGALNLQKHIVEKYEVLIATSLGEFENKVLRIGHMGENANLSLLINVLNVIDLGLKDLGFKSDKCLVELFNKYYI